MASPVKRKLQFRQWVEKRWPLVPVIRWGSVEEIPGGARFAYALGSATMVLFGVLVITGVWQLLYYVPTLDHAYDSVMFLRLQVPLGWLVHGLHYWAAQGFIVVMGLHMAQVFIWAAYKKPRELTWVLGVVLLLLGAAFVFTGAILPWDALGYWAGEVGTSMAGTVPLIGNFLKFLMRGGDTMGQMTLSRSFVVHVAILPALTVFFIVAHLVAFRQFGSAGPWKPKQPEKSGSFWPEQTFKDLLLVAVLLLGLICLSAFVPAPISGPADPLDNTYTPKPEWNFLFLYEALKAFKGSWEWLGTVVIPASLILLLFAVPFIDRNEKKNPFQRPVAMLSGFLFVAGVLVMTFIGYYSDSGASKPAAGAQGPPPGDTVAALPTPATNTAAADAIPPPPTNQAVAVPSPAPSTAKPKPVFLVATQAAAAASAPPASTNQVSTTASAAPATAEPPATGPSTPAEAATHSTATAAQAAQRAMDPVAHKQNTIPSEANPGAALSSGSTNGGPTYLGDVQPIFATSCARCHNPQTIIYNWLDYKSAFADRREMKRRVWDSWEGGYYKEAMPMPGSPEALAFTTAQRSTIRDWVAEGAVLGVAPTPVPTPPGPTNPVAEAATSATSPATPGSSLPDPTALRNSVQEGKGLFASAGCVVCHKIEGNGGVAGPDLSQEAKLGRTSQWLITQITDPRKHVPTTIMPARKDLTPSQLADLADFLLHPLPGQVPVHTRPIAAASSDSTNKPPAAPVAVAHTEQATTSAPPAPGPPTPPAAPSVSTNASALVAASPAPTSQVAVAPTPAASATKPPSSQSNLTVAAGDSQEARGLFVSAGCATCHTIEGKGGKIGPDLSHEAKLGRSDSWLIKQITDPGKHDPSTLMPAHKNLTQQQLAGLAHFILNPSSSPTAPGAGIAANAEKPASAPSSSPVREQANAGSTKPSSAPPIADDPAAPVPVVKMIGDPNHGAILFELDCVKCHGTAGEGHVANPGSLAGVVAPLAPIARGLFSDDAVVFAANIDRFIQHGATPPGPAPTLQMPAFGTTHSLTVQQIANIEAYVLSLNGVDAAKIIHPGITPLRFVEGTGALFALALLAIAGLWVRTRTSSPTQPASHPTPEEFQALRHEVAGLKQKLEAIGTRNPKADL
jgi:ubiquinol-cytochrome c reductase cytochrome b subunit